MTGTFKEKLEAVRKQAAKPLSDAALASKLNVSRSTIHRWTSGDTMPDHEQIAKLSSLFKVPRTYWTDTITATVPPQMVLDADEEWLVEQIRRDNTLEEVVREIVLRWRFPEGEE